LVAGKRNAHLANVNALDHPLKGIIALIVPSFKG
jgi:hypothetical protein